MERLRGLELLRGAAALLVLVGHVKYPMMGVIGEAAVPSFLMTFAGPFGVDLFFILSGFLIAMTLDRPQATAASFFAARVARVVPLYLVLSLICLALPMFRSYPMSVEMVFTTLLYLPAWGDALLPMSAHPYGWTLSFEMYFYLIATGCALVFGASRAAWMVFGLMVMLPAMWVFVGAIPGWAFPSFAASPMGAEFALGILAYKFRAKIPSALAWPLIVVGSVVAILTAGYMDRFGFIGDLLTSPQTAWARVCIWGLPALAIVVGSARVPVPSRLNRIADWLGGISYSVYLVQPFAFVLLAALATALGIQSPWLLACFIALGTVGLAAGVSQYVDHPLHKAAKVFLQTRLLPTLTATPRVPSPSLR
ncbi:MAG: acyltransferase family protein [Fimbriiglobus sp.]